MSAFTEMAAKLRKLHNYNCTKYYLDDKIRE